MSYIVPIGPYHPALEEPIHAKLYTEGEVIKDAEVFVGYNHRGIEKLATERNAIQTLVLVERVCGICSHSHAWTYAMAVEAINQLEVPRRGEYIRVITGELERLHSHFLWAGIALHIIGHDSMFMHVWDKREVIMDMLEELSGNRVNYAMCTIGGARRDISPELKASIEKRLDVVEEALNRVIDLCVNDRTVALRTKGVGVMTTEEAVRMGAVGPHARPRAWTWTCGATRRIRPTPTFDFKVPVVDAATCYCSAWSSACWSARRASASSARPWPACRAADKPRQQAAQDQGRRVHRRHEAPRGQLVYKVVGDGGFNNHRVSIHVPSFKNTPTVPVMLRGNTVADAGLIIASIDPCFSCLDR